MSNKISYAILSLEVEKLYQQNISLDDKRAIDQHIKLISEFIKALGWTEEEYFQRFIQEKSN